MNRADSAVGTVFGVTSRTPIEHGPAGVARLVREALDGDAVAVHYQPIVDLSSEDPVGAEALVRIVGPDGELVGPDAFLEVAAATGMMRELTRVVLDTACRDFAADPGLGWVSVNLSSRDLVDPSLVDTVAGALVRSGLPPRRLVLEISERTVPSPSIVRTVHELSELGVGVALDDFGSDSSSVHQLRDLPVRLLKIDRSLVVRGGVHDARHDAILRALVQVARSTDVVCLAEGVETEAEQRGCRVAGFDLAQGWRWGRAIPFPELRSRHGRRAVRLPAGAPSIPRR